MRALWDPGSCRPGFILPQPWLIAALDTQYWVLLRSYLQCFATWEHGTNCVFPEGDMRYEWHSSDYWFLSLSLHPLRSPVQWANPARPGRWTWPRSHEEDRVLQWPPAHHKSAVWGVEISDALVKSTVTQTRVGTFQICAVDFFLLK
jgi:hypothetical protein